MNFNASVARKLAWWKEGLPRDRDLRKYQRLESIQVNMAATKPPNPGPDAFHRERSKCLDAFVASEEAVIALLRQSGTRSGGEPFGKKVENLRKAKASLQYPAPLKARIDELLRQFDELMDARNDLVHARLQIAVIGEDQRACFINARQCANGSQSARLFSLEGLRALTRKADQLAQDLRKT
jgi:hypothetical protein